LVGIGATIGDSIFFYMGLKLKECIFKKNNKNKYFKKIYKWITNRPRWIVFLIIYVYAGLTPFPGDLLVMALALAGYSFKKILLPLLLGNITLIIILGYFTLKGIEIF
ncbi:MAG: VTT domain-containing protein, partial [Candidatus Gracilibacteria bacterium]